MFVVNVGILRLGRSASDDRCVATVRVAHANRNPAWVGRFEECSLTLTDA